MGTNSSEKCHNVLKIPPRVERRENNTINENCMKSGCYFREKPKAYDRKLSGLAAHWRKKKLKNLNFSKI